MIFNAKKEIPLRRFQVEFKHRPPEDATGECEELVETVEIKVPKLKNSAWEVRWVAYQVWERLESEECKAKGINQAFIFTADFGELLLRMEVNPFQDEEPERLSPPSEKEHQLWKRAVEKRFRQLHGISLEQWQKQVA